MTQRERLFEELAALDNGALYDAFANNRLPQLLERRQCLTCMKIYGSCPRDPEDDEAPCELTLEAWLDLPWDGEPLLPDTWD